MQILFGSFSHALQKIKIWIEYFLYASWYLYIFIIHIHKDICDFKKGGLAYMSLRCLAE